MTAARVKTVWQPLTMTWAEAADATFRKSENWLRAHIREFRGFPAPDPDTDLFLGEQVQEWLRVRYGILPSSRKGQADLALERAKYGKGPREIPRN